MCRHKSNNINFHLTPNPKKSNYKIFGKTFKNLIFGHFGPILSIFQTKKIFLKKWALSVFRFYSYLPSSKKSKKLRRDYQVKLKTDRWTDGSFIGSSIYGGPKNDFWSLLYHKMVHFSKHGLIPLFLQTSIENKFTTSIKCIFFSIYEF